MRTAVLILARDVDEILEKRVVGFAARFGLENLHLYFEGLGREVPLFCEGASCHCVEFGSGGVRKAARCRLKYLSERAAEQYDAGYERVVGLHGAVFLEFRLRWFGVSYKVLNYGEESFRQV